MKMDGVIVILCKKVGMYKKCVKMSKMCYLQLILK